MHRLSVITSLEIMSDETIELPKNDLEIMVDGRKNSKTSISGILHVLGFYLPPLMDTCSESPHLLCLRHPFLCLVEFINPTMTL